MADKSSGSPVNLFLKIIALLLLTIGPCTAVFTALISMTFVPRYFIGPSLVFSGLVFFVGAGILLVAKNIRYWFYSLIVGFATVPGCIVATIIVILSQIRIPLIGSALEVVVAVLFFVVILVPWYLDGREDTDRRPGQIQSSTRSVRSTVSSSLTHLWRRSQERIAAVELTEVPHGHAFPGDTTRSSEHIAVQLHRVIRALNAVPFALRIERLHSKTRVLFLTWARDEAQLDHQHTLLMDALQHNLVGFRFQACTSFSGIIPPATDRAAAATITGVPKVVDAEGKGHDTLEALAGVLQGMTNGIYHVSLEPFSSKKRELRSLESQYQHEMERSEKTISRKKSTLFSGVQQESRTIVDPEARLRAERLERRIRRLSNERLCKVSVTVAAWHRDVAQADRAVQRLAGALIGSLRPADEHEEFDVHYTTKDRTVKRSLLGFPAKKSSVLTIDEAAGYVSIPRRDLEIPVTSRERFSSGTRQEQPGRDPQSQRRTEKTTVSSSSRLPWVFFGSPIDQAGRVLEKKLVVSRLEHFDMHFGIFGATRSGKTTTALSICAQSMVKGVNPLILALTKGQDWWPLTKIRSKVRVFTCGRDDIANLAFNMWRPPEGVSLNKWIDRLVQVWTLWLPSDKVIAVHIDDLIHTVYDICGYDRETGEGGRPILLPDIVDAVEHVCRSLTYEDRVVQNFHGILATRVRSILRKPSLVHMYNTPTGVTIKDLLSQPTIVDMTELSDSDRILLMGLLTAGVIEYKLAHPEHQVTNLLVLEEAHYLLGKMGMGEDAHALAVRSFIQMLRVLGGTGLGVIILDQSPTELVEQALKIIVNLVIHALPHQEDRELVGRHARCTNAQIEHIGGMEVGEAVVYLQDEGEPKNVRILPLEKMVPSTRVQDRVAPETLRSHMQKIIQKHPEFQSSEALPEGLIDRLKHPPKRQPREETVEPEVAGGSGELQRIVTNETFAQYCRECLERGDGRGIANLILSAAERHGDGSRAAVQVLLGLVADEHMDHENAGVLEQVTAIIDGADV